MKKSWLVGVGAVLVVVGVGLWSWTNRPRWSTRDPGVLALVEQAQGELNKLYYREAAQILERALAKDPNSFVVRYLLHRAYSGLGRSQDAAAQLEFLKHQDQAALTPRERMLLDLLVLRRSGDREAFVSRLLEYHAQYPREVELARALTLAYQERGDLEQAEKWGRKTLELDANDALSYNLLGYLELRRGRFAQAEEQFRKYAFIAPDQANPHDSLGELFLITGRYPQAEEELQTAVQINPRFYPAWRHRADLAVIMGKQQEARFAVTQLGLALDLSPEEKSLVEATLLGLLGFFHRDGSLLSQNAQGIKAPRDEEEWFVVHVAACTTKDWARAEDLESSCERSMVAGGQGSRALKRLLPLLKAQRLLAQGRWQEALTATDEAVSSNSFVNAWQAHCRLIALCYRAEALVNLGKKREALEALEQVRSVNPRFPLLKDLEGKL